MRVARCCAEQAPAYRPSMKSKYPDWAGQWKLGMPVRWDPSKPPGRTSRRCRLLGYIPRKTASCMPLPLKQNRRLGDGFPKLGSGQTGCKWCTRPRRPRASLSCRTPCELTLEVSEISATFTCRGYQPQTISVQSEGGVLVCRPVCPEPSACRSPASRGIQAHRERTGRRGRQPVRLRLSGRARLLA
jgi:hypothetical protein